MFKNLPGVVAEKVFLCIKLFQSVRRCIPISIYYGIKHLVIKSSSQCLYMTDLRPNCHVGLGTYYNNTRQKRRNLLAERKLSRIETETWHAMTEQRALKQSS